MSNGQDRLYRQAEAEFAPAIARLARAMERDADKARDLEQDIHTELWRSFARFDGDCALKTWVYRIAHNVAADHVGRAVRRGPSIPIDEAADLPVPTNTESDAADSHAIARAHALIRAMPSTSASTASKPLWLRLLPIPNRAHHPERAPNHEQ